MMGTPHRNHTPPLGASSYRRTWQRPWLQRTVCRAVLSLLLWCAYRSPLPFNSTASDPSERPYTHVYVYIHCCRHSFGTLGRQTRETTRLERWPRAQRPSL